LDPIISEIVKRLKATFPLRCFSAHPVSCYHQLQPALRENIIPAVVFYMSEITKVIMVK
jgi:hypothetical protein